MNTFASGPKRSYYGKGDVSVYKLRREGSNPGVFGANVKILIYGDAFWPTYTTGDNSELVATDSMKNFIQREAMNYTGEDLESFCRFLAEKFLLKYPQAQGAQVSAEEIPYEAFDGARLAYAPAGPERAFASLEVTRDGVAEERSGIRGFRLLRLSGSAFKGFVRDEYTTLPDIANRPLHMWLDLDWTYRKFEGPVTARVREIVRGAFAGFESGSIQQIIYQVGQKMLAEIPSIAVINLEANNRTWDTIAEEGSAVGVYTEARPPYGCLGLTLRR